MADSQNTVAGTANGGELIPTNGNWFLDGLASLGNVLGGYVDTYSGFLETQAAIEANSQQAAKPPMQTAPTNAINNPADFFSDPARVQRALIYTVGFIAIATTLYLVVRKG